MSSESSLSRAQPAILVLADGSVFRGLSIGADGITTGEVVFNTALTGYQEILTDPSYSRQIVTLTYPHIGNTGVNAEDVEADRIHAAGLVVRDVPRLHSNFRASQSLPDYLKSQNIVAIADIDTRRLTRILREKGAQSGCIMAGAVDEAKALRGRACLPGPGRHGSGQGGERAGGLRMERNRMEARARLRPADRAAFPCGRLRLRRQAQHPAHAGRARLPPHRAAGHRHRSRGAGAEAGRCLPLQRPRRSGTVRLRDPAIAELVAAACRLSASASATSCSRSPRVPRP